MWGWGGEVIANEAGEAGQDRIAESLKAVIPSSMDLPPKWLQETGSDKGLKKPHN